MPSNSSVRVSQSVVDATSTPCSLQRLTILPGPSNAVEAPVEQLRYCVHCYSSALIVQFPGIISAGRHDGTIVVADGHVPGWCRGTFGMAFSWQRHAAR